MSHKNILIVMSKFPPEYSGPGVRIPRLYEWLKDKKQDLNCQVLCNSVEYFKNASYVHHEMPVQRLAAGWMHKVFFFLPKRVRLALVYQFEFIQGLWTLHFSPDYKNTDFLHVVGHSGVTAAALFWAKSKKIPVLMELVNNTAQPYQKFLFFFKVSIPKNGVIATLTQYLKGNIVAQGFQEKNMWFKPNPIDTAIFKYKENKIFHEKLPEDFQNKKIILSIAKIIPRKNQILLIQALRHLPNNFCLVIAGPKIKSGPQLERDNTYIDDMRRLVTEHHLENRVLFIFEHVNAIEYIQSCDVYAMPAWDEGFGTPMLEAMGCGLPVVANADEISFQEWITEGKNGFIKSIDSPKEWAEAIEKASEFDHKVRAEISKDIHEKASQDIIFQKYKKTILES